MASVTIVTSLLVILLLRLSINNPNDGLGLLNVIPITLAAIRFGPRVGTLCGLGAFGLFMFWAQQTPDSGLLFIGYVSRFVVFITIGMSVGYFARARAEVDTRSRRLFDLSPDLLAALDSKDRLITSNEAWERFTARNPDSSPLEPIAMTDQADGGTITTFEQILDFGNGDVRSLEWRVRTDSVRRMRYVVGRDVTERVERAAHVKRLLTDLQDVRYSEHKRVASDLHDSVLQYLLVALMHVEEHASTEGGGIGDVDRFVRDAASSLRGIIDGIQPFDIDHLDSAAAIERCVIEIERTYSVTVDSQVDITASLDSDETLLCYRFTGEALRNAAKHADAAHITLRARELEGFLDLTITDDGRGLGSELHVSNALCPQFGTGFNLLLEQMLASHGTFAIDSSPGSGVTVHARWPLTAGQAPSAGVPAAI